MEKEVRIPHTRVFEIHSEYADAGYQVWVARPMAGFRPIPPGPLKTLYVLDADLFFGTAVEMTRLMSQLYGELPPLLVVGIGYGIPQPALQAELRARDFTPTVDAGFGSQVPSIPGAPEPTLPEDRRLGRAPQFLDFLTREVKPLVERNFDTSGEETVLFGSSLGGLFTVYTMLEHPTAFDSYLAVSPALWWDEALLLRKEEELASTLQDLPARLFMAVGEGEEREDIPMLAPFKMISNLRLLGQRLGSRGYSSLDLSTLVAEGESHTSVVPTALTRGLRHLLRRGG